MDKLFKAMGYIIITVAGLFTVNCLVCLGWMMFRDTFMIHGK